MGILLDIAYALAAIAASPWLLRKKRRGWAARFGRGGRLPDADRPRLLLHAVSVGEVNLLRGLVDRLAPEFDLVVASTTDTGFARARELFEGRCAVVRYPLDFTFAVRRFLDRVRPDAAALVELELWPNFLRAARRRKIPVAILNGRLSDRSFARYDRLRVAFAPWFRALAAVGAQDQRSGDRFRALGVSPERIEVLGNMKWDAAVGEVDPADVDAMAERFGIDRDRPLIVVGSSSPDEHALIRDAAPANAQVLFAPRRPEWFGGAARDLPGCVRWSAPGAHADDTPRWFLLDALGQLSRAYRLADVVVIGRSFVDLFGSDPMEPAALGKPLLIGPAHADFRQPVESLRAEGGVVVSSRETLARDLASLVEDRDHRERVASAARTVAERNRGATDRHADMLRALLQSPAPPTASSAASASS